MMKKRLLLKSIGLLLFLFFILPAGFSQTIQVSGKVTGENEQLLSGATVTVKGTPSSTITGNDGMFKINVPSLNAVLVISFIGYKSQEVPLDGKSTITVTLKPGDSSLGDVVVIGYGTVKRADVTGAITGISEKDIRARPVANALEAMQGKVAGVDITSTERPGTVASITIRGVRSLTASNSPLFVVDGIPLMSGGIDYLNPNDIESIDVLKDASATAIYGARGANGVVIVTTKQGKAGKTALNLNASTTFETLVDKEKMFNAADYITFRRWAYYYKNTSTYPRGDEPTIENDKVIFLATSDPSAWANIAKGWASGTWDGSKVQTTDWRGMVTQTGITHNLNLSVSGGSDKVKAYASFGYLDNTGTQKGQSFKRYAANVNVDIKATKWFSMGSNLNVSYSIQEYGQSKTGATTVSSSTSIYESARALFPYAVPYDSTGERIENPGGDIAFKNVVNEWNLNQDQRTTLRAFGSFYGQIDFGAILPVLKNLKYRVNFGPDFSYYRDGTYIDENSVISSGTNSASLAKNQTYSYTLDHLIYYNKSIGKHDIGLTLLGSQTQYSEESSSISANGIAFASQKWNALSDTYISADNLTGYSSGLTKSQLQSYMARINYGFNDKYLLTVSARRDGASQLAEGHKYSWFPSAAIAWRINNENFMSKATWVNDLKLRLGVGVTGNSAIDAYATQGAVTAIFYPYISTLTAGAIPSTTLANQNLGWEKTTQYNIGIDFSVLNRRISGSLDLYESKTTDLLMEMSIPTVTGYTTTYANVGETANKGIDLSLTTVNVNTGSFNWTTTASVSWQKDHIVSLSNGNQDDINNNWFIGQPIGVIYGYKGAGLWHLEDSATYSLYNANGSAFSAGSVRPVDINGDTAIDANYDRATIGNTRPRWVVGMTNTFTYKGFELSVFLYGRLKYLYNTGGEVEGARSVQRVINYYNENNMNAEYQKPIYSEGSGDSYYGALGYKKASFIKIRNISLGYNLNAKALKTTAISGLKLYVQVANPGMLFSKISWLDMDLVSPTYNRGITIGLNAAF
ncbi:SusC/RagA family TonB-linked outer membrane protein [Parafilimonas sp.]|uniref:SusC/RagA family TonB-linked outer membrane protein n=1 Tax=Parafilimonas sp. TaxID=1969739 RepID=UPI0039E29A5D